MAAKLSNMDLNDFERLRGLIERAGLPAAPPRITAGKMRVAMGMDKKVQGKRLRFVLLDAIGASRVSADYDEQRLDELVRAA